MFEIAYRSYATKTDDRREAALALLKRSRCLGPGLSILSVSVALLIWQAPLAKGQGFDNSLGTTIGCHEDPSISPYCTDPDLRALAFEFTRFEETVEQMSAASLSSQDADAAETNSIAISSYKTLLLSLVGSRSCRADASCISVFMETGITELYEKVSMPRPAPLTDEEIASYSAREQFVVDEQPDLRSAILAMDDVYRREWSNAEATLSGRPWTVFRRAHPSPDEWVNQWDICVEDLMCHNRKGMSLRAMLDDRDIQNAIMQERLEEQRQAAALREEEAQRQAVIAEAEAERQEAERLENEEVYARRLAAAQEQARQAFPPQSMLLYIIQHEFTEADRIARQIALEIYDEDFAGSVRLFAPGMDETMRAAAINNRRNLALGAYGLTRFDRLGACGERVVTVSRQLTDRQVTRNAYNVIISDIPAQYSRVDVPASFVGFVENTIFERGGRYFREEVDAIAGCDTDLRVVLEDKIMEFSRSAR